MEKPNLVNTAVKKCNYEKLDNARRKYKRLLVEYKGGNVKNVERFIETKY